jgi:steroid delta-isomerase
MAKAAKLDELVSFYENLTLAAVDRLGDLYADEAEFKDPFNEVCGVAAIARIFRHMFVQVDAPRFVVTGRFTGYDGAMLLWDFHFRTRGTHGIGARELTVRGASHLRFDDQGKVMTHRDYWDTAEELYAKLPVLGVLVRGLQRAGRA